MAKLSFAQLMEPSAFRSMPWKNGRGTTLEIATEPAGAALDDPAMLWRLSTAPVTDAGPFSAFPGFDRILTLTEGRELALAFADRKATLRPGDVFRFYGEEAVSAELPAGPVRDLGLLYRPEQVRAEMNVLAFKGGVRSFAFRKRLVFFYAAAGDVSVGCFPGGEELRLKAGAALRVETLGHEKVLVCEPKAPKSVLISVELDW